MIAPSGDARDNRETRRMSNRDVGGQHRADLHIAACEAGAKRTDLDLDRRVQVAPSQDDDLTPIAKYGGSGRDVIVREREVIVYRPTVRVARPNEFGIAGYLRSLREKTRDGWRRRPTQGRTILDRVRRGQVGQGSDRCGVAESRARDGAGAGSVGNSGRRSPTTGALQNR